MRRFVGMVVMVVACFGAWGNLPVGAQQDFVAEWRILAEQGHAEAQAALGAMYLFSQDYSEAIRWLRAAADQDVPAAQLQLGHLYATVRDVQDDEAALRWFRRAAAQGVADAEYALGVWYVDGRGGLEQDDAVALRWFRRAAAQGVADAQFLLGMWSVDGRGGLEQDGEEALRWLRKAADQSLPEAELELGRAYAIGRGVEQDDEKALAWFRRAATEEDVEPVRWLRAATYGMADAQYALGLWYRDGRGGVAQNDAVAVQWFLRAAEQGSEDARAALEGMYNNDRGIGRWYDAEAEQRLRITAERGSARVQYQLGDMYRRGVGLERNDAEALRWYREAAEQGLADAYVGLARLAHGGGDYAEAERWYREAADQGFAHAQNALAGILVDIGRWDEEIAHWTREAADQGLADAQCELAAMYEDGILGVPQSDTEAARWQRLCDAHPFDPRWWLDGTEGGRGLDQYETAARYEHGVEVEQDHLEALRWYRMAAAQEHLISELARLDVERLEE